VNLHPESHSQAGQESFVLLMTKLKNFGTYLEIGAYHPTINSNTYILESEFNWHGISIELDAGRVKYFNSKRINKCLQANALRINYKKVLKKANFPNKFEYLQFDIDPAINTFVTLLKFPLLKHKAFLITFEHDKYANNFNWIFQLLANLYLNILGYKRIVKNVSPHMDGYSDKPFEDWFIRVSYKDLGTYRELLNKGKF
jgi:hypothetical protein